MILRYFSDFNLSLLQDIEFFTDFIFTENDGIILEGFDQSRVIIFIHGIFRMRGEDFNIVFSFFDVRGIGAILDIADKGIESLIILLDRMIKSSDMEDLFGVIGFFFFTFICHNELVEFTESGAKGSDNFQGDGSIILDECAELSIFDFNQDGIGDGLSAFFSGVAAHGRDDTKEVTFLQEFILLIIVVIFFGNADCSLFNDIESIGINFSFDHNESALFETTN